MLYQQDLFESEAARSLLDQLSSKLAPAFVGSAIMAEPGSPARAALSISIAESIYQSQFRYLNLRRRS